MNNIDEEYISQDDKDFAAWLTEGIDRGWVTDPYCVTHDGGYEYMSEEELQEWEDGGDPCQHVVRLMM